MMDVRTKKSGVKEVHEDWSPYVDNGGSCACYCGNNFAAVAADTRLNLDYSIPSRDVPHLFQLTSTCVLAAGGMQSDIAELVRHLKARVAWYSFQNHREIPTRALAHLLSTTLYGKRFFPYYAFCILLGMDTDGKGICFEYDAVGSYEEVVYGANGSAKTLMQPFLDSQVNLQHQKIHTRPGGRDLSVDDAKGLLRETLAVGAERDIHTGDWLDLWIISAGGVSKERFPLKFD